MEHGDLIVRGTALHGKVRALAAVTTETMRELQSRHDTWPVVTAALGRTVTMGAIMGAMLKDREKLTIQVKGDGPIGQIVVDANADGEVRGYVREPHVDLPLNERGKLDVRGAVGQGFIYVIKDLGLKEPYRGGTPIVSGEIAEDFAYYFTQSEQTPSAVALGVLVDVDYSVKVSGGFLIQVLPGLSESDIAGIEAELAALPPVTRLLEEGLDAERILKRILPSFEKLGEQPVRFRCQCSRERIDRTLISLGKEELRKILEEDGKADISCHFCNETYAYTEDDLLRVLDQM